MGDVEERPAAENNNTGWARVRSFLSTLLMCYFFSSFFAPKAGNNNSNSKAVYSPASRNLYKIGDAFDLHFYLDESEERFQDFNNFEKLFWSQKNLKFGDWTAGDNKDGSFVFQKSIKTPAALRRNESIYLHIFMVQSGASPDPKSKEYAERQTHWRSHKLNKYRKKVYKKTANLLTGESEQSAEDLRKAEKMKFEILNFWHPNLTINIVADETQWTRGALPSPLKENIEFDSHGLFYFPIVYFNDFWNLGSEYQPINATDEELMLSITYAPLSLFKFQMYAGHEMRNQWSSPWGDLVENDNENDQDSIKQAMIETNPILLGVTMVVSLLHTVFEFLAFKNDIQFWRTRKDLVGLSVRSVFFKIFQSLIVFLYICDNDTNFVVKMSVGVGLLIECWKIPKVTDVTVHWENKIMGIIPRVSIADKGTYIESDTKVYDDMAFKYLSFLLFPLLGCYAVYSVIYEEQRGWYSWILSIFYGFLLTFGFITMTPQLFINYKLKSVAHLPWGMLTYKFINTFIDDLFAFVIRMPTLYRLGCFRDDIIFLIYLYQRWIYRVDPKRQNEFGTSLEDDHSAPAETAAITDSSDPVEKKNN